jgi:hypothetical protein
MNTNRGSDPQRLILYFDARLAKAGAVVSLALAGLQGKWFYAEAVDAPIGDGEPELERAAKHLRKVPGTTFVKRETLAPTVQKWLAIQAQPAGELAECIVEVRSDDLDLARTLLPLLAADGSQICRGVEIVIRRAPVKLRDDFIKHCGGPGKVVPHSLVGAVSLAVCDPCREEPMQSYNIHNFELLMGFKNAMSYRAWVRRHEAARINSARKAAVRGEAGSAQRLAA